RIKIDTIPYFSGIDAGIDYGIDSGIEECIDRLIDTGFVTKYRVADTDYLHINGFEKHQKPHKNERDAGASIPGIEEAQPKTDPEPNENGLTRADSLVLIPDSLVPRTDTPNPVPVSS